MSRTEERITARAERVWARFRRWPRWARALGWLLGFWLLLPILTWRSPLDGRAKVAVSVLLAGLLAAGVATGATTGSPVSVVAEPTAPGQPEPAAPASPATGTTRSPSPSPAAPTVQPSPPATPTTSARRGLALVTRVIDGDTIEVRFRGRTLDVRLIGVDTPETVRPGTPVECFGRAASAFTRERLEGKLVRLEFDVERLDRYGRTLAYVWVEGRLFNEILVTEGYAQVATYPPNVRYVDRFLAAQGEARQAGRGLWGGCPREQDQGPAGDGCDPSYPDVCIQPFPPDLDCADVPHRDFRVTGSDPHGFDGDGDGVGCES